MVSLSEPVSSISDLVNFEDRAHTEFLMSPSLRRAIANLIMYKNARVKVALMVPLGQQLPTGERLMADFYDSIYQLKKYVPILRKYG